MLLPDTVAGAVITALRYLGRDAVSSDALQRVASRVDASNKARLRAVRRKLSGWLGDAVEQIAASA